MAKRVWKCAIPAICVILQCLGILIPAEASQKFFSPSGAILETRPDYGRKHRTDGGLQSQSTASQPPS